MFDRWICASISSSTSWVIRSLLTTSIGPAGEHRLSLCWLTALHRLRSWAETTTNQLTYWLTGLLSAITLVVLWCPCNVCQCCFCTRKVLQLWVRLRSRMVECTCLENGRTGVQILVGPSVYSAYVIGLISWRTRHDILFALKVSLNTNKPTFTFALRLPAVKTWLLKFITGIPLV